MKNIPINPVNETVFPCVRLKSFVRRNSRETKAQARAFHHHGAQFLLRAEDGCFHQTTVFGKKASCFLEIGFGSGLSLLALAKNHLHQHFIGVETHKPGIGNLLQGLVAESLQNLRIYHDDVITVLEKAIPNNSLTGVSIFFPDPWPKRKHHQRRLISPQFLALITPKLITGGEIHLATDWDDYAKQMLKVLSDNPCLVNGSVETYSGRSPWRPVITKFETRAIKAKRNIWDLRFIKK